MQVDTHNKSSDVSAIIEDTQMIVPERISFGKLEYLAYVYVNLEYPANPALRTRLCDTRASAPHVKRDGERSGDAAGAQFHFA